MVGRLADAVYEQGINQHFISCLTDAGCLQRALLGPHLESVVQVPSELSRCFSSHTLVVACSLHLHDFHLLWPPSPLIISDVAGCITLCCLYHASFYYIKDFVVAVVIECDG